MQANAWAKAGEKHVVNSKGDLYLEFWVRYTEQDIINNRSYVEYNVTTRFVGSPGVSYIYDNSGYVQVTGTGLGWSRQVKAIHHNSGENSWKTIGTWVTHDQEGKCEVQGQAYIYFFSKEVYASGRVTLPTIPRNAIVTKGTNFTDETNPTIYYSNPAGEAVDALEACLSYDGSIDDFVYTPISKNKTSFEYKLTTADREKLRKDCANAKSRNIKLYVRTTIGTYTGYSHKDVTMTIDGAEPTIDSYVAIDTNQKTIALTGNNTTVVNGYSNLELSMSSSAKKSASIKKNVISYDGKQHESSKITWNKATSGDIEFQCEDSRGYKVSVTKKLTFKDYFKPKCTITLGTPNAQGNMSFTIHGSYWKGNFGAKNNTLDVQYIVREKGASTASATDVWVKIPLSNITFNGNSFSHTVYLSGLDYRKTYSVQAWMGDSLDAEYSADLGFSTRPVFDWSKTDFSINVPVKLNGRDLFSVIFEKIYPIGSYYWSSQPTNPSELFGGKWEQIKDKFIYAVGSKAVNVTGGEEKHTLIIDEMPKHGHSIKDGNDNTVGKWDSNTSGGSSWKVYSTGHPDPVSCAYATEIGGGKAHNNMPPYITAYCWRRIE